MAEVWNGGDETGADEHVEAGGDGMVENEDAAVDGVETMKETDEGGERETHDSPHKEGEEEEEDNPFADDDDDEEEVQVTIGEIRPNVQFATTRAAPVGGKGATDLDTVPVIDGVILYDIDLAQSEDKPWRKPGADPSDYFNYGFTEETWNLYCERQKKLRLEFNSNQHMVNRHIMAGITLSNPLGNAPAAMSGNNRVLVDNTRRYHHNRNHDENSGGLSITRLGSTPANIPTLGSVPDFSRPPPIMTIPTMGGAKADHSGTSVGSGEPAPPGSEEVEVPSASCVIPTVNTSLPPPGGAPMQSISSMGAVDMSMPPPGFNPAMPPPHLMGPPSGGMPNTTMPPPGFNPMMPPPHFGGQGGPGGPGGPMFGRGYTGGMHGMGRGMGRPPPLMRGDHYSDMHRRDSSEFERERRERESSGDEEDRRHRRSERKKSRSPSKGGSSRRVREDRSERRERGEERERSSRRHRSSSRERRDGRKREESKRSRGGADEERSEKKKRRYEKDDDHSSSRSKRSKRDDAETVSIKQEPIDTDGNDE